MIFPICQLCGAQARDVFGTTSGQVTDMEFNIDKDEMYASWIGSCIWNWGYGVAILFN